MRLAPYRDSIMVRILLILAVLTVLVGLAAILTGQRVARVREERRQQETLEALLGVVEPSAAAACFVEDRALAQQLVDGLTGTGMVLEATLGSQDRTLAWAARKGPKRSLAGIPPITRELYSPFTPEVRLGRLTLVPDPVVAHQQGQRTAALLRTALIALALALGLALAFTLDRTVFRHLSQVSARLKQLETGAGGRLALPKGHERDEIGQLIGNLNALVDRQVEALWKEQELNELLAQDQGKVREILETVASGVFVVRGDGGIEAWTPEFLRLVGHDHLAPMPGQPFAALFGLGAAQVEACLTRCRASGAPEVELLRVPETAGGDHHWVQLSLDPIGPDWIQGLLEEVTQARALALSTQNLLRDPLTGALNRLGVERALAERMQRSTGGLALLMVDLDAFHEINDTFGTAAGDEVLRVVAVRMRKAVRGSDAVARLQKDEFLVILDYLEDDATARSVGDKVLTAIGAPLTLASGDTVLVGASGGLTLHAAGSEPSRSSLLRQAALALALAKSAGRNRCEVA